MAQNILSIIHNRAVPAQVRASQWRPLLVCLLVALGTIAFIPIANQHWPLVPAFLPAYQTAIIFAYSIVAYLIYTLYKETKDVSLLYLWAGSVYTAIILTAQFLSFRAAFIPAGSLIGGTQTTIWLWCLWHIGPTSTLLLYSWAQLRHAGQVTTDPQRTFYCFAAATGVAVFGSLAAVTTFHHLLPILDIAGDFNRITSRGIVPAIQAVIVIALFMLWRATRFRNSMHAWLGVALVALLFDNMITSLGGNRLSVGWYVGRFNALISALVMLAIYLKEINSVYLQAAGNARKLAHAHAQLEVEQSRLLKLFEQAPGFVAVLRGPQHRFELANHAFSALVGSRPIVGQSVRDILPELEGQGYFKLFDDVFNKQEAFVAREMKITLKRHSDHDLEELYIDVLFQPVAGLDGAPWGIFVQGNDVTEQKQTQDKLVLHQANLERLVLERTRTLEDTRAALLHSQKLEAVGKLTGGVAHDFNNVLHIIGGNLDLIARLVPENDKIEKRVASAHAAVDRGAKLSSQLLAFARKQPLDPVVINPRKVVSEMELLIKGAVGEKIGIDIMADDAVWNSLIDRQQLENVILNLALNASDAMAGGGKLTINISNVVIGSAGLAMAHDCIAGEYVQLAIQDTGSGMTDETKERAFDPFFTTKPMGQGTGLGLSMAYGFIKQSGGHIAIDSAVGHGTTVNIYLPRSLERVHEITTIESVAVEGGNETILVVEDDKAVQSTVVALLAELGYQVLTADNPDMALKAILTSGEQIDLLFTDVVMPGELSCTDLVAIARQARPTIQILFTSGYTQDAVNHNGRLDPNVKLLSKPYQRETLAYTLRSMLSKRQSMQRVA